MRRLPFLWVAFFLLNGGFSVADSIADDMCSGKPIIFESRIEHLPGGHVTLSDGEGHSFGEHRSSIKVFYKRKPLIFRFVNKFLDFGEAAPDALYKITICKLKETARDMVNPDNRYFLLQMSLGSRIIYGDGSDVLASPMTDKATAEALLGRWYYIAPAAEEPFSPIGGILEFRPDGTYLFHAWDLQWSGRYSYRDGALSYDVPEEVSPGPALAKELMFDHEDLVFLSEGSPDRPSKPIFRLSRRAPIESLLLLVDQDIEALMNQYAQLASWKSAKTSREFWSPGKELTPYQLLYSFHMKKSPTNDYRDGFEKQGCEIWIRLYTREEWAKVAGRGIKTQIFGEPVQDRFLVLSVKSEKPEIPELEQRIADLVRRRAAAWHHPA
jgi:hypothetical protein